MYDLARDLKVAPSVLNDIADSLEQAKYIVKIVDGTTTSYTLACPPEHITIGDILYNLKMTGGFRSKHLNRNDKYKNIIYQNKAITPKDYNTTLFSSVMNKKK